MCGSVLSANTEDLAETYGYELPETPGGAGNAGLPALASVDLRNFAQWQICGNNVAASTEAGECDNSIAAPPEPTDPGTGFIGEGGDRRSVPVVGPRGFAGPNKEATVC